MIKIEKSKYIKLCLTVLLALALIFSTLLVYFLGWNFQLRTFGICIGIIVSEMIGVVILYIILVKTNKSYYIITNDVIKLVKKEQEVFCLLINNIITLEYIRFAWIFLLQLGAGYLHIEYTEYTGEIDQSTTYFGKKVYSISMSKKQAEKVAFLLNKNLKIK